MADGALACLEEARSGNGILVSPVSAWEVGLLHQKGRTNGIRFDPDPATWFSRVRSAEGIGTAPLTFEIALSATSLPGSFHGDPADRWLVATARELRIPIVTRDRLILAYADEGHVSAVPC